MHRSKVVQYYPFNPSSFSDRPWLQPNFKKIPSSFDYHISGKILEKFALMRCKRPAWEPRAGLMIRIRILWPNPDPNIRVKSGSSGRTWIRILWSDPDPDTLVGSGFEYSGRIQIRILWSDLDPNTLVESGYGYSGRVRIFLSNPDLLAESGSFGLIRIFWPNPDLLIEFGSFGRIHIFRSFRSGSGFRLRHPAMILIEVQPSDAIQKSVQKCLQKE